MISNLSSQGRQPNLKPLELRVIISGSRVDAAEIFQRKRQAFSLALTSFESVRLQ